MLLIAAVIVMTIVLVDGVSGFRALIDVLILGVALAVAAVPEGLAAVVTAALAIGVQLFRNPWLWGAVGLSLVLQLCVVSIPFLQRAFATVGLSAGDWLRCTVVASSVVWLGEIGKLVTRRIGQA